MEDPLILLTVLPTDESTFDDGHHVHFWVQKNNRNPPKKKSKLPKRWLSLNN